MSYGRNTKPLYFEGLDLVCLSGDNGVGKSTILDAITWALWGKARAKFDDDLIRKGENTMWVELVFDLEKILFRIVRKRTLAGKGKASLQLWVSDSYKTLTSDTENQIFWRSITESTKKQTQDKINEILKMRYNTFINSAFLRQGHADEFTIKSPTERKEILSEVLGLSYYDLLEKKAKEYSRAREIETQSLTQQIQDIEEELLQKEIFKKELEQIKKKSKKFKEKLEETEKKLERLRAKKNRLESKSEKFIGLQKQIAEREEEILELKKEILSQKETLEKSQKIISKKDEIIKASTKIKELEEKERKLSEKLNLRSSLKEGKIALEKKLINLEQEISLERNNLENKKKDTEAKINQLKSVPEDLKKLILNLKLFDKLQKRLESKNNKLSNIKEQNSALESTNKQIVVKGKELRNRNKLLEESKQAKCPLCTQNLSLQHKKEVLTQISNEIEQLLKEYNQSLKLIKKNQTNIKEIEKEIKSLEKRLSERSVYEAKRGELENKIKGLEDGKKLLSQIEERLKTLDFKAKNKEQKKGLKVKLDIIDKKLATINYDEKLHQKARQEIQKFKPFEKLKEKLQQAEQNIKYAESIIDKNTEKLKTQAEKLEKDKKEKDALGKEISVLQETNLKLKDKQGEEKNLKEEFAENKEGLGTAQEKLLHLQKQERTKKEKKEKLKIRTEEKGIYEELALAFGKKGIQAMIIENVIPEIEKEANDILKDMTDGRMKVKLETQRAKKMKDKTIETLDIKISDERGERPYELYSGGEAYRINFAIRVSLSKLLTRRAGAKLELLAIDEGFGAQDTVGKERLVSIINFIKKDFKKIIVITHVPEIKEAFPIELRVSKEEDGSHIEIIK